MSRLVATLLAVALAGTASAAGWKSLRIDGSSDTAFDQSLSEFNDKLSPGRRYVFGEALRDIWLAGIQAAEAAQREYTAADFHRQVDGLSYEEVVTLLDPTGETARRHRAAYNPYATGDRSGYRGIPGLVAGVPHQQRPAGGWGTSAASLAQQQQQCRCMAPNGPQGN